MNKKDHGERNYELSDFLFNGKKYYDWVVTTSFYACIHFVEDRLLPTSINGNECKVISEVRAAYKMKGRHEARERLVFEKLELATAVKYKWLDDKSRYSRYRTYKVTVSEAEKAKQYAKDIHKACYPGDASIPIHGPTES